jgi:hypothetical protein
VLSDYDAYDNLILVCGRHRAEIDSAPDQFDTSRLRELKARHEDWAERFAGDELLRLVPDPTRPIPMRLRVFNLASSLWNFMGDAQIFYPGWPNGLTAAQEEVIAAFVADLVRWRDVAAIKGSFQLTRQAARQLAEPFGALLTAGLVLGARERQCLLLRFALDPLPMRVIYLDILPAGAEQGELPCDTDLALAR